MGQCHLMPGSQVQYLSSKLSAYDKIGILCQILMDKADMDQMLEWYVNQKCSPPSPHFIKQSILERHGISNSTWVETGTFKGNTTAFLANRFKHVHSIEPQYNLYQQARKNLSYIPNITLHLGTSEDTFETVLGLIRSDVCFWLDGHYSSGDTFRGHNATPIKHELRVIAKHLAKFSGVVVLIDDIRMSS